MLKDLLAFHHNYIITIDHNENVIFLSFCLTFNGLRDSSPKDTTLLLFTALFMPYVVLDIIKMTG